MTKNRLIWNIALFLIAVMSLPLAYAQTSLGGSLYFVIVNAAIIGIILFALQAYLIPGKPEKERTVVWVVVLVASLLIAWLVGRDGYIWQGSLRGFFSIYVLVNAILIGAFLYFLLGFLKIGQLASTEGRTGYGILLFLVAMVFAVKLGNQWLWDQGTIRLFGSYLFGSEGILNPSGPKYRLWTFIGSAVLLTFFFQNYLVTGGEKKVNYALALIIAANLASGGIAIRSVVIMAEIVFLITMAKTLGTTTTTRYGTNWFVAAFLIGWGSAAATYGTEYEGGLARIVGWFLGWFGLVGAGEVARPTSIGWWGKVGLVTFIIVGTITFFVFVIGRGENIAILRDFKERYGRVIFNRLKRSADSGILRFIPFIGSDWHKRETPEGMLPQIILENLDVFHTLTNWMKRIFIFFSKWQQVRDGGDEIGKVLPSMKIHRKERILANAIKAYRTGGEIENLDQNGDPTGEKELIEHGWFGLNKELVKEINEVMKLVTLSIKDAILYGPTSQNPKSVAFWDKRAIDLDNAKEKLSKNVGKIVSYKTRLKERLEAYGPHHVIKAWQYLMLDQVNPSGRMYPHTYYFIPAGTKVVDKDGNVSKVDELTEVDMFGNLLEDEYNMSEQYGDPIPPYKHGQQNPKYIKPRRVEDTRNIVNYSDAYKLPALIDHEWQGFMLDLRYGTYHPYSRSWPDYESKLKKIKLFMDDSQITADLPSNKDSRSPAFDREALKNPGQHIYWGRTKFEDEHEKIEPKNPYPSLSSYGLTRYLTEVTEKDMVDKVEAHHRLNLFLGDTGDWITSSEEAKRALGLMGEIKKEGAHGK